MGIRTLLVALAGALAAGLPGSVTPPLEPGAPGGPRLAHRAVLRARADVTGALAVLVIANDGPAAATGVRLTAPPTVLSAARFCTRASVLRCRLGTIPPRGTARVELRRAGHRPAALRISAANAATIVVRL